MKFFNLVRILHREMGARSRVAARGHARALRAGVASLHETVGRAGTLLPRLPPTALHQEACATGGCVDRTGRGGRPSSSCRIGLRARWHLNEFTTRSQCFLHARVVRLTGFWIAVSSSLVFPVRQSVTSVRRDASPGKGSLQAFSPTQERK